MTFIVQSYFDTLLRYVLSLTFCGAVVLKVIYILGGDILMIFL